MPALSHAAAGGVSLRDIIRNMVRPLPALSHHGQSHPDRSQRCPHCVQLLLSQILLRGPLSMAEYMKLCLSHPTHGYYMKRDVFGTVSSTLES